MYNSFEQFKVVQLNQTMIDRQQIRCQNSDLRKIIEVLELPTNPTILDLGAGSGQYSYAFAEYLHGQGRIFAVEVAEDRYNYICEQINLRNYKNVLPLLLSMSNDDDFYWQNNYDLVWIANSFEFINNREIFLKKMHERLTPRGKLAVMIHRDISDFVPMDVIDSRGLVNILRQERLIDATFKTGERIESIAILNSILNSTNFTEEYLSCGALSSWAFLAEFEQQEKKMFGAVLGFLKKEEQIFDDDFKIRNSIHLNSKLRLMIKMLNKLILSVRYRKWLRRDVFSELGESNSDLCRESNFVAEVRSIAVAAGFRYVDSYDFIPWYYLVVFAK